jgi:hypothetical protein
MIDFLCRLRTTSSDHMACFVTVGMDQDFGMNLKPVSVT